MSNDEILKRISDLEKQIQQLSKKEQLNMFGKNHDVLGSSSSDLILKTKGKIKIQWGNVFIDLLKNGKLNVDTEFIFKAVDKDSIGNKPGIYITDNGEVYIKQKSEEPINILGEVGTTYVSFMEEQETTSENKHTALTNIGFLYPGLSDIKEDSLKNGIIYVEAEQKLYTVKDGELSEYTFKFPNPFTEQFIIAKNDNSKGSLYIKGQGINNSIAFDNLFIYGESDKSVIQSDKELSILFKQNEIANISNDVFRILNIVETNKIQSPNATSGSGFRLYYIGGKSILEVDKVIERDATDNILPIYPEYWFLQNNVIKEINSEDESIITFEYKHNYVVGDELLFYVYEEVTNEEEDNEEYQFTPVNIAVKQVIDEYTISTDLIDYDISNTYIFLTKSENKIPIRLKSNTIDLFNSEKTISRFGELNELELKGKDNNQSPSSYVIKGNGIYSELSAFLNAQYLENYTLENEDNSSRFASTEWVQNLINNLFPIGSIIMFNGQSPIPDKWHICNGQDGTPNLIGKFIRASETPGEEGGSNTVTVNGILPEHQHNVTVKMPSSDFPYLVTARDFPLHTRTFDRGGDNNFCLYDRDHDDDTRHYSVIEALDGETSSVGTANSTQTLDIVPEYYSLIYIMKIK